MVAGGKRSYQTCRLLELLIVVRKSLWGICINVDKVEGAVAHILHHSGGSFNWVLVVVLRKVIQHGDMAQSLFCGRHVAIARVFLFCSFSWVSSNEYAKWTGQWDRNSDGAVKKKEEIERSHNEKNWKEMKWKKISKRISSFKFVI